MDCRSKDVEKREIYIVEGDSALGSVKLSRDAEYQGIMPVRGKILNCLKADYARIFKSEIITDLIRVLGCGVEIQNKHVKDLAAFDLNNLRWNKVVICTDGDVDGFQIRTLILTMLYRLTPTLIQQGYVYIAETPLFEINCGDKTWFAYSDKEKADIVKSLEGKKYKIDRSKGLGENDPDMMWLTTMNPETRRLIRVMPEDVERTAEVFDLLLGDNLQGRKDHIAENGARQLPVRACRGADERSGAPAFLQWHDGHPYGHPAHAEGFGRVGQCRGALLVHGRPEAGRCLSELVGVRHVYGRTGLPIRSRTSRHADGAGGCGQHQAAD